MAAAAADVSATAQAQTAAAAATTTQAAATTTQAAATTTQAAATTTATATTAAAPAEWFYADGIKGTGDRPDYYRHEKYKTLAEQARAYPEAEKQIGVLTGKLKELTPKDAPAEYALPDLAALGGDLEWRKDDPLLGKAFEVAKKHKLSQDVFADLAKEVMVPLIRNYEMIDIAQEKSLMGERADERLTGLLDWGKRNLSAEQFNTVNAALGKWSRPHEVFAALETVLAATRQAPAGKLDTDVRTGAATVDEINRKYRTVDATTKKALIDSPDGLKKYREELRGAVGDADHIEIVGKR